MAKKKLRSGFELLGIAPNLLLKQVQSTAPFLFSNEIDTSNDDRQYLAKLIFYKKNLKQLSQLNLSQYFHLCLCAHWATAGTFVPTDVDKQIREGLWKHKDIKAHIEKMARITIESWSWDFAPVTNRKSYNRLNNNVLSTHEGTWLSVAIGAYCALIKHNQKQLAKEMEGIILLEIKKEEDLLLQLQIDREYINFIRSAPLIAHNFGDLDRVILQWDPKLENIFCKKIFKLGHQLNKDHSAILVFAGSINKEYTSKENHRHMSMRQAKCLRKSQAFLIPVGPFMDNWGIKLGTSTLLNLDEKAEIIAALFDGFLRQDQAFGYCRAYSGLIKSLSSHEHLELLNHLPYDLVQQIKLSKFKQISEVPKEEFESRYIEKMKKFICPKTNINF